MPLSAPKRAGQVSPLRFTFSSTLVLSQVELYASTIGSIRFVTRRKVFVVNALTFRPFRQLQRPAFLALKPPFPWSLIITSSHRLAAASTTTTTCYTTQNTYSSIIPIMTLKDYALDYSKCTGGELYRFLRARCDPAVKVKKGLPKHYYLSRLKAADKNATFRFGDLPAELQDKIYGEVLHLQRSYIHHKQVCYPQILATCKQINVDARDILYGKNDFQVKLEITAPPRWASDRTSLWIVYDQDHHTVVGEQLSKAFTSWRLHLRKVHHLKVIIDASHDYGLGVPTPDSDVKKFLQCANSSLYSLCTFLAGQNQLKKLEVHLSLRKEDQTELDAGWL